MAIVRLANFKSALYENLANYVILGETLGRYICRGQLPPCLGETPLASQAWSTEIDMLPHNYPDFALEAYDARSA